MKVLFLADLHIKLGQKNVPKEWAINRYMEFFKQLREVSTTVDSIVIGGDTFDRIPTLEELQLFFQMISSLPVLTYIFDGNHEATKKGKTFLDLLKTVVSSINPNVVICTETTDIGFGTIVPYCKIHDKNVFKGLDTNKPLFTHVRGEIPPHVKPEIDLDLLKDFNTVFAGDLHSHTNTQRNIVYPGSPMTTSFHRGEVTTGYIILEKGCWSWKEFYLPQLIRKTVYDPKDMVPTEYHHTIYELEGDLGSLSKVKNSELLDKKIVKRSSETALILKKDMTIEQELSEYLLYIQSLNEGRVHRLIGKFHDNIAKT
jgi:DNA repair exonuclease SbcCD nuclease subunit